VGVASAGAPSPRRPVARRAALPRRRPRRAPDPPPGFRLRRRHRLRQRRQFSRDGRWVTYSIGMSEAEREELTKQNRPPEPRLGLLDLARGDTLIIPACRARAFSHDGRYLAMRRYSPPGDRATEAPAAHDLVVRDLPSGTDTNFGNVGAFAWQDGGPLLAMTVVRRRPGRQRRPRLEPRHRYPPRPGLRARRLPGPPLAPRVRRPGGAPLLRGRHPRRPTHVVLVWRTSTAGPAASPSTPPPAPTSPPTPGSTTTGSSTSPTTAPPSSSASAPGSGPTARRTGRERGRGAWPQRPPPTQRPDSAGVEVWHSRDVDIIPRQKLTAERDRERSHLAVWHLARRPLRPARRPDLDDVQRVGGDRIAVGIDETPHELDRMFGPRFVNVYVIDTRTGETGAASSSASSTSSAPAPRAATSSTSATTSTTSTTHGRTVTSTSPGRLPTELRQPRERPHRGPEAALRRGRLDPGDRTVLLYDRYDVWEVRPDGSGGRRLTDGRADSTIHRYLRIGWDERQRAIDPRAPAYYNITGRWSKRNGYAVAPRLDRPAERAIWLDASVGRLARARTPTSSSTRWRASTSPRLLRRPRPPGRGRARHPDQPLPVTTTSGAAPSWSSSRTPTAAASRAPSSTPPATSPAGSTP
jgi:hypothetical protein